MPSLDHDLQADLKPYFDSLRFYPHQEREGEPVEQAIKRAHKVFARPALVFDDAIAVEHLKSSGITQVQAGATNEIWSPSSHSFAPAQAKAPVLASFKFHSEHSGRAPAANTDCLLKPVKTHDLSRSRDSKTAWLELLPEVQVLTPEHPEKERFQSMLLKHCAGQDLVFYDSKVDRRTETPGVVFDKTYTNFAFPERSNIALIPVIQKGKAIKDNDGKVILAPVIIDAGSILPMRNSAGETLDQWIIPNLERKDLTFAKAFKGQTGYDYTEIKRKTEGEKTLAEYVSKRHGAPVDISYREMIGNYAKLVEQMHMQGQQRGR